MQDHVEAALSALADSPVSVTAAGRTDTGVHALAQVIHFDTEAKREDVSWVRGTNARLDPAARVVWARETNGEFHARFSARSRTYRYLLLDAPVAPAILRGKVGWFHQALDVERMAAAAKLLLGEHDFSSFRAAECQAKSPVKTLHAANVMRSGALVDFTFHANAFLHHMVRNVVGALVYVGAGRQPVEWVATLLEARDRTLSAPTFMPDGLFLAAIEYDAAFDLPAFPVHSLVVPRA